MYIYIYVYIVYICIYVVSKVYSGDFALYQWSFSHTFLLMCIIWNACLKQPEGNTVPKNKDV